MLIARQAARLSELVDHVVQTLAVPLADPMQTDWIAVPARGTQGWLIEQLVTRVGAAPGDTDGIVANVEFAFPGTIASRILSASDDDPWALDRAVWTLLALIREGQGDPALGPLGHPLSQGTAYGRARHMADLFDRYNVRRPGMIRRWAQGDPVDAAGNPLGTGAWQAELWQRLRTRIGQPSAAELLPGLLADLRRGDARVDLPERLMLFGLSVWPERLLQMVSALSVQRDVHLLTLAPSPALTASVIAHMTASMSPGVLPLRSEDPSQLLLMHPLVGSWGRPMREAAVLFAAADMGAPGELLGSADPATGADTAARPTTLLGEVQAQVRENRMPDASWMLDADDSSFSVHACHGPVRQVEVLHELLLHAFEDDTTLTEDDVAVLVPDIAAFSPIVDAVFGGADKLRYRITDQAIRSSNAYASAVLALVELLVAGRYEASKMADFMTLAPVRLRFSLDDDDLRGLTEWILQTNVRWGLNAATRAAWNVHVEGVSPPNTWRSAVDQLLLGAAVPDSPYELVLDAVPTVPVEGPETRLVGHLAEIIALFEETAARVAVEQPAEVWFAMITDLAAELFAVPTDDLWQQHEFDAVVANLSATADNVVMTFADAAAAVSERLEGTARRASFLPGTITITSLPALRSVPHRIVCILGLDDAALASSTTDGDDLTLLSPRAGDPDGRNDGRQVLLEGLLSASERLIITRTGHDVVRNHEVQEAVPVTELWDVIAATVSPQADRAREADGAREDDGSREDDGAREAYEFRHTRHGFDQANFCTAPPAEPLGRVRLPRWPFGHEERQLLGAQNRRRRNLAEARPSVITIHDLDVAREAEMVEPPPAVSLAELHRLLRNPIQFFVQAGLQARIPYRDDPVVDTLPVDADALESWRTSMNLLQAQQADVDSLSWLKVGQARGAIAAGALPHRALEKIEEATTEFLQDVESFGGNSERESVPIAIAGTEGQLVTGTVAGVDFALSQLGRFEYKRAKPHHQLALWLDLIALTLAEPEVEWLGALVTRKSTSPPTLQGPARMRMRGMTQRERVADANLAMDRLLTLHSRALREPVPLFSSTSYVIGVEDGTYPELIRAWENDLKDDHIDLGFQGWSWRDLESQPPRGDDPSLDVGGSQSRVRHWAHWLWGTVDRTVVIVEEAGA